MSGSIKKLTDKEKAFCVHYCGNGYNATQAAINAGYSEKTANVIASQNLSKLYIQEEIARLKIDFEDLMAEYNVTRAKTALEVSNLAYSGIAHLHNTWIELTEFESLSDIHKKCIQEIDTKTEQRTIFDNDKPTSVEVKYVKIKLFDKLKAVEILNKMMGWNAADKTDITTNGKEITQYDLTKLSKATLKELLDAIETPNKE